MDFVLVNGVPNKLKVIFDRLSNSLGMSGMGCEPSKCKIPLQDWIVSKQLDQVVDLGTWVVVSVLVVLNRMKSLLTQKFWLVFANLEHLTLVGHSVIDQQSSTHYSSKVGIAAWP